MLLAVSKVAIVIFIAILLLYVNPKLSIVISVTLTIAYGIVYYVVREYLRGIGELSTKATFEKYKFTDEAFSGIKDIKLRGTETEFIKKYSQPAKNLQSIVQLVQLYHCCQGMPLRPLLLVDFF